MANGVDLKGLNEKNAVVFVASEYSRVRVKQSKIRTIQMLTYEELFKR